MRHTALTLLPHPLMTPIQARLWPEKPTVHCLSPPLVLPVLLLKRCYLGFPNALAQERVTTASQLKVVRFMGFVTTALARLVSLTHVLNPLSLL